MQECRVTVRSARPFCTALSPHPVLEHTMRTTVTATASPGHRPGPIAPEGIGSASPRAWWGDRGVKTKVLAAVEGASLVAVVIGVMGLPALGTSADSSRMLYASNIAGLTASADMRTAIADVRIASRNALLEPDRAQAGQILDSITDLADQYRAAHDAYTRSYPTPEKLALNEEALTNFDAFVKVVQNDLRPLAEANDYTGWFLLSKAKSTPLASKAQEALDKIREIENGEAKAAAAQDQYRSQRTTSIVVLLVGIAVAVGVGLVVAIGMARGVGRVQRLPPAPPVGGQAPGGGAAPPR